jgi:hypothetical protein
VTDESKLIDPTSVASKFLAEVLALTPQAVSRLATERIIRTNGKRGKYDLTVAVPQYIGSLRGTGAAEAKAKLAVQQERKLRLANDAQANKLVAVEDAAEAFRSYCLTWRAGAAALPRRLATQLSNEKNPAVIQRLLQDEFAQLFNEMESGLSEFFAERGEAFAVAETGPDGESAPAKKNARPVGRRKKNSANRKRGTRKVAK